MVAPRENDNREKCDLGIVPFEPPTGKVIGSRRLSRRPIAWYAAAFGDGHTNPKRERGKPPTSLLELRVGVEASRGCLPTAAHPQLTTDHPPCPPFVSWCSTSKASPTASWSRNCGFPARGCRRATPW